MKTPGPSSADLRSIPLLRDLTDPQMEQIVGLLKRADGGEGDALFAAGSPAQAVYLLMAGEVTLFEADEPTHHLKPPVMFGEIGALAAGQTRNSRAVIGKGAEIWRLDQDDLFQLFAEDPALGLRFHRSLLTMSAYRMKCDQRRLADMRHNLIRTQKAMKQMRDFLLQSEDTVVSKPLHEILEGLIKQNRRVNYRVEPPPALAALVRMDDRTEAPVVEISRTHVSFRLDAGALPSPNSRISGVLCLSGPEIPISGVVLRTIDRRIDLKLDLLIDEFIAILEGYLTRVQMLDFLV